MKEKNTMKDNNMNIMEQVILREGPEEKVRVNLANKYKDEYNELYAEMKKGPAKILVKKVDKKGKEKEVLVNDPRTEKLGILWVKHNGYKSGYRVKEELDGDNGPIDLILERIENDKLVTHRIDVKSIHPNAKVTRKGGTEPSFKVTGAEPKFLKRNKIYERKIAIIYKGKCIIREGWHVNTNNKELKVFDHDTSEKTEYIK